MLVVTYELHKLLKKYENKNGDMYTQCVQCLWDMAVESKEDDFIRKWFDQVNKLALFVEIEKCVRFVLPQHIIRGDSDKATFRKSVIDVIIKNEDVQFLQLQDITVHAEALLTSIVNLWVTMAASWMAE